MKHKKKLLGTAMIITAIVLNACDDFFAPNIEIFNDFQPCVKIEQEHKQDAKLEQEQIQEKRELEIHR